MSAKFKPGDVVREKKTFTIVSAPTPEQFASAVSDNCEPAYVLQDPENPGESEQVRRCDNIDRDYELVSTGAPTPKFKVGNIIKDVKSVAFVSAYSDKTASYELHFNDGSHGWHENAWIDRNWERCI